MSTALYRRYRPDTFADVIGQEHVTEPLMAALKAGRVSHAYLFSGPRGCGKTTSARIFARCLNCVEGPTPEPCGQCESCRDLARGGPGSLDVVEIDAASHNGVDDARDLRERAAFAPARDRYKIFILDEAHMVTPQGFNALLKLVEEPPAHVKFIFATTEPEKVIGTIRSRTHHYPFRLVPPEKLTAYLQHLCEEENIAVASGVLPLVVRAGGGSVRDSLSVLDQLMAGAVDGGVGYERAAQLLGYTSAGLLDDAIGALAGVDGAALFRVVDNVVESGHDPRRFTEDLLERLRDLVIRGLIGDNSWGLWNDLPADQRERLAVQAEQLGPRRASLSADTVHAALMDMTGATSPRLQLELLCGRLILAQQTPIATAAPAVPAGGVADQAAGTSPAGPSTAGTGTAGTGTAGTSTAGSDSANAISAEFGVAGTGGGGSQGRRSGPKHGMPAQVAGVFQSLRSGAVAEPEQPDDPAKPMEPAKPADSTRPMEAAKPNESDTAAEPAKERESAEAPAVTTSVDTDENKATAHAAAAGGSEELTPSSQSADLLRRRWDEVLEALKGISRVTWALVQSQAAVGPIRDNELALIFRLPVLLERFRNEQHSDNLAEAIFQAVGIRLTVAAYDADSVPTPPAEPTSVPTTPAEPVPEAEPESAPSVPTEATEMAAQPKQERRANAPRVPLPGQARAASQGGKRIPGVPLPGQSAATKPPAERPGAAPAHTSTAPRHTAQADPQQSQPEHQYEPGTAQPKTSTPTDQSAGGRPEPGEQEAPQPGVPYPDDHVDSAGRERTVAQDDTPSTTRVSGPGSVTRGRLARAVQQVQADGTASASGDSPTSLQNQRQVPPDYDDDGGASSDDVVVTDAEAALTGVKLLEKQLGGVVVEETDNR